MREKIPYETPAQSFLDRLLQLDQINPNEVLRKQIIDALASGVGVIIVHPDGSKELLAPKQYRRDHVIMSGKSKAVVDVLIERERQQQEEGWTPAHDDRHPAGTMAKAAVAYACDAAVNLDERARGRPHSEFAANQAAEGPPPIWPWDPKWWKPSPTNPRRDLVKAAALLLAEIDRLDRTE